MSVKTLFIPLGGGGSPTPSNYYTKDEIDAMLDSYGAGFEMSMNGTTFVITASLKNADGDVLGTSQTIDLPLESVVVNGSYDSNTKKIILTLENGTTIDVPVGDLVSGLQTEITAQNPLSADLLTDGTTNKVFTATEQSKLAGLTVNDATITIQQDGTTVGTFTTNDANDTTINLTGGGGGSDWYGTQAQFDAIQQKDADTNYFISGKLDYNTDLKNTPDLSSYATKTEVQTADATLDGKIDEKWTTPNFMTEQEFSQITPKEGENYFIQGETVAMTFTLAGGSTVTYNVVVD